MSKDLHLLTDNQFQPNTLICLGLTAIGFTPSSDAVGDLHPTDEVEFQLRCTSCDAALYRSVCSNKWCRSYTNVCAVCRQLVTTRTMFCLVCGHGGHERCLKQWLAGEVVCPTGCGCRCGEPAE